MLLTKVTAPVARLVAWRTSELLTAEPKQVAMYAKPCTRLLQLFGGATDARSSLTKLAGDVSSWWANFDPSPKQAATGTSSGAQDSSDVSRQVGSSSWCFMAYKCMPAGVRTPEASRW